jgi:hypothetical protein
MSLPDEEFGVVREDEVALLTKRFKRLQENRVNTRKTTRTCFQCGKPGHFVAYCPEKVENKDGYKHWSRMDNKNRSRRDHKHKHKNKQRLRKKDGHDKKARAMIGAINSDSGSTYSCSSSSSNEDEGDQRKSKK